MNSSQQFTHCINPADSIEQLKSEITNKDASFFTFDFKHAINNGQSNIELTADDFWKLVKIKAKKVSLFVDEILSCDVLEEAPLGFIREISMPGSDITQLNNTKVVQIRERVVIDEKNKMLLFFQLEATGKILLFAINQVSEEANNVYFSGHYVYNIFKNSSLKDDQVFMEGSNNNLPLRVANMISRMKALAENGEMDEIFQQLYSRDIIK